MSYEGLKKLAEFYGVPIDDLIAPEEPAEVPA